MKTTTLSTLVLLAAGLQQALATGWSDVTPFDCPSNGGHECDSKQYSGFDWAELELGVFIEYAGFHFDGYECVQSFNSRKRDLVERTFQEKCAQGTATSDVTKNPKIKCGSSGPSAFNINYFQITVEFDCDMEFHYTMGDGSICKHKASCQTSGTIVKNTQCGGAVSVSPYYPAQQGKPNSCKHGLHGIGFYCPPGSSSSKPVQSTTTKTASTTSENSPSASTSSLLFSTISPSLSPTPTVPVSAPSSIPNSPTTSALYSPFVPSTASTSSSLAIVTPPSSPLVSSPLVITTGPNSPTSSAHPRIVTIVTTTTTSICPVTSTVVNSGTTSFVVSQLTSTVVITATQTICTKCTAAPTVPLSLTPVILSSGPVISSASSVAAVSLTRLQPAPTSSHPTGCPDLVPQCIKMWLPTNCGSNADVPCFCASIDFVSLACGCINSHGQDDNEITTAIAYFQGLCSSYISKNPALMNCGPSYNKTIPGPVTTVTVATIVTIPCSTGTSSILIQTLVTAITVPQVVLQTTTGAAVLVSGTGPIPNYTSSFSTTIVTGGFTASTPTPSSTPALFTGAASQPNVAVGVLLGAAIMVMAL